MTIYCSRCGAESPSILAHWSEVHGGVPQAKELRMRVGGCTESCDNSAVRSESSLELIDAMPYLSKPPSSSSVRLGPDNSNRHDWRAS